MHTRVCVGLFKTIGVFCLLFLEVDHHKIPMGKLIWVLIQNWPFDICIEACQIMGVFVVIFRAI